MRKRIVILLWIILQVGSIAFLLPQLGGSKRWILKVVYIFDRQGEFEIIGDDKINLHLEDEDYPLANLWIVKNVKAGPIDMFVEFYETRSIRWDLSRINAESFLDYPLPFSDSQLLKIDRAVSEYALIDPLLISYNSGGPSITVFSPRRTKTTVFILLVYVGIPLFLVTVVNFLWKGWDKELITQRRVAGLCPHCTYDCTDLTTTICPECGKLYMVPNS